MSWQDCTLGDGDASFSVATTCQSRLRADGPVPVVSSSGVTGRHNVSKAEPPGVVTGSIWNDR